MQYDAAMERAAVDANIRKDDQEARLAAEQIRTDSSERKLAAEVGVKQQTGDSAGGSI